MSPVDAAIAIAFLLYYSAIAFLCVYGANCYVMVWHHVRHKKAMLARDDEVWQAWMPNDGDLPVVTVQLPLYNEQYVVARLIETITRLDFPRDRLEIQVLDDSTDETTQMARDLVEHYKGEGFDISLCHRSDRTGFKAGALKEGLKSARGEFIAIFDADFVPNPDFLRKTLPFLEDPDMAMVQTLWGHLNRDYSLLTQAQSVGLDGSNYVVQAARCWSGAMMQFQGTGGIWRKSAIEDAGGWHADTLTEDLDLSYRAQLKGWKMKFLPQVLCPGELPATMSAAKTQQHRWAKGGLQNAFKLISPILRSNLSGFAKFEATFHLVNYLIHPFVVIIALSWPLHILLRQGMVTNENILPGIIVIALSLFGPATLFIYAQRDLYPNWKRQAYSFFLLVLYGMGIAINNTKAVFEVLLGIKSGFVRTPKFRIEHKSDSLLGKASPTKLGGQVFVELLLAAYCLYGIAFMFQLDDRLVDPFLIIFAAGACIVAGQTIIEKFSLAGPSGKTQMIARQSAPREIGSDQGPAQ